MRKEEAIVNGVLWNYYTDEELLRKVQEISAAIPPEENKHFVFWMLRGMATHEIIHWYNVIKLSAPHSVFAFYCQLAEEALPKKIGGYKRSLAGKHPACIKEKSFIA